MSDPAYETTRAPIVTQYPYLAVEGFRAIALPRISRSGKQSEIVHRAGFTEGFKAPHILIPQGVERSIGRVRAAYTEQNLVFEHSLQAIAVPPSSVWEAKLLTAVLNSSLAAWFYFHDTANLGADRAKVHQNELLKLPFALPNNMPDKSRARAAAAKIVRLVDEEIRNANQILQEERNVLGKIDRLVFDYYGLDGDDIALVEDTFQYIIPAMQPRRGAGLQLIWATSNLQHRRAYAKALCEELRPWFRRPVVASLVARSSDIAVLRLHLAVSDVGADYHESTSAELEGVLKNLAASLPAALPGNVHLIPDLRIVIGQDMYLVKPTQLRYWLRSAALADAEQIALEFTKMAALSTEGASHAGR